MALHTVAVLADVHFHDPAGDFGGAGILADGVRLALRSWADTRIAARAFNETAGVLRAALEKIAAAGVRHVVLAGDYSDDGQAANIWRLVNVLEGFEQRHGLQFYAIPGNHDLYGPHGKHVTTRFVSAPGQTMMVTSDAEQAEVGAIVTPAMRCGGQPAALLPMARFGLFRQPEYLHWESPFGLDDRPEARIYEAVSADGSATQRLMDASYLVEPEPGLWLLMIDANVFEPRAGRPDATRKKAFIGPSDAGWNAVLRVKPFLLDWIADVTARAQALGKTLVAVSHYPVLDPFQDVAGSERALFGETAIVRRTPGPQV
ncbi:MAG: metallophosphoesterase, partial [Cypionkella sp.]|nr:metallophosphoesterase [Cypionkella sp.]